MTRQALPPKEATTYKDLQEFMSNLQNFKTYRTGTVAVLFVVYVDTDWLLSNRNERALDQNLSSDALLRYLVFLCCSTFSSEAHSVSTIQDCYYKI